VISGGAALCPGLAIRYTLPPPCACTQLQRRGAKADANYHLQRGDGLEQQAHSHEHGAHAEQQSQQQQQQKLPDATAASDGASAAAFAAACTQATTTRRKARDAFSAGIELEPTSVALHLRLGAAQARLERAVEASKGEASEGEASKQHANSLATYRRAWQLQQQVQGLAMADAMEDDAAAAAFARDQADLATAGAAALCDSTHTGVGTSQDRWRAARSVGALSVDSVSEPAGLRRALSLWRRQGVVVFPSLLNASLVRALRGHAQAAVDHSAVDRSANIRAPALRTLRALSMTHGAPALREISSVLSAFLAGALIDPSQLLLEVAAYRASSGALAQGWHRDDGVLDSRLASVQIALVDTAATQGALEVQPASHTHDDVPSDGASGVKLAVPEGSVVVYSPNLVHRGGANTHAKERLAVTLNLMGSNGLVPNGIPLAVLPEDAGRWRLAAGRLLDGVGSPAGH
jgi:hypothetical protein